MPPNLVANVAEMLGLPPLFLEIMSLLVIGVFFLSRAYFIAQKTQDQGLAEYLKHLRQLSQVERVYRRGLLVFFTHPGRLVRGAGYANQTSQRSSTVAPLVCW